MSVWPLKKQKNNDLNLTLGPRDEGYTPSQVLVGFLMIGLSSLYLADHFFSAPNSTRQSVSTESTESKPQVIKELRPEKKISSVPPKPVKVLKARNWQKEKTSDFPELARLLPDLRTHELIFVYDLADKNIKIPSAKVSPLLKSLALWLKWSKHHQLKTESCSWKNLSNCQKNSSQRIFVVLPGRWKFDLIEKLMSQGERLILFGMPYQVFEKKRIHFKNLVFEKNSKETNSWLTVRGDQALTLGLEAGYRMSAPPLLTSYRVRTSFPHAIGASEDGEHPVRLGIIPDSRARVVWLDFAPQTSGPAETIQAGIFRFLLRKKHFSFASWPYRSNMASAIFIESTDLSSEVPAVHKSLFENQISDLPLAWIVRPQSITNPVNLSREDSVLCQLSFEKVKSIQEGVNLINDCRERVKRMTSQEIAGIALEDIRPSSLVYDSLYYSQVPFLLTKTLSDSPMPVLQKSERHSIVVLPKSYNTLLSLSPRLTEEHFHLAVETGSFSQVYTSAEQIRSNTSVLKVLFSNVNKYDGRFLSAEDLAQWMTSRDQLLRGESVLAEMTSKYLPYSLRVDENGRLLSQGINGVPDRMPAAVVPYAEH